jgi:anti-sigma regulatory factor (Ser/Thr protein kinase)
MSNKVHQHFEGTPAAVREARLFLQAAIADRADPASQDDLTLALSELATNAVRHARTPFEVVVETNGHVRIEVEDRSTDSPQPKAPSDDGGRGLAIVDQLCDRWGIHVVHGKKCVWCERDLAGG